MRHIPPLPHFLSLHLAFSHSCFDLRCPAKLFLLFRTVFGHEEKPSGKRDRTGPNHKFRRVMLRPTRLFTDTYPTSNPVLPTWRLFLDWGFSATYWDNNMHSRITNDIKYIYEAIIFVWKNWRQKGISSANFRKCKC